ncbi:MAG TPA: hypothetical protein VFO19_02105, partial [Vicinamibacterales bacterium]|nr:hypothetical protein [Vicinamibacterales bacterium]
TLWTGAALPQGQIVDVSPDGRSVLYTRREPDGALVLRDVATGADRRLTTTAAPQTNEHAEYAVSASFSRDGRRVAYNWRIQERRPLRIADELRMIDLSQPAVPTPRVLFRDENTEGYGVRPLDWFPDDERIGVLIGHGGDRTRQLGFVSVRDGKLSVLRSLDWRNANGVSLSPDGRFVAYDLPPDDTNGQRDVFVLATDGSRQAAAVDGPTRDEVVAWSPDGTRLLFLRDRHQLWAQPMSDGRPVGPASMLKADARGTHYRVAATGDLFEFAEIDDRAFYRVPVDFATGRSLGPPAAVAGLWPAAFVADWSPDGRSMASMYGIAGDLVMSIQSLETGSAHVLSLPLSFFDNNNFQWMPDGRALLARAAAMNGRLGFYRIDVADGSVTPLLLPPGEGNYTRPQLSPDGRTLYYIKAGDRPAGAGGSPGPAGRFFVERDLATGREREIVKLDRPNLAYGAISPDGKFIGAMNFSERDGNRPTANADWIFSVISTIDGTEREVFRAKAPVEFLAGPPVEWSRDGRFMVVRKVVGASHEVWSIPVGGGEPRKLDLGISNYTGKQVRISPDGQEIVVQGGSSIRREVRIVERFLPPAKR